MTLEMAAVFALVAAALVLFATERLRVDLVALLIMGVLMVSGLIGPEEGLAGFANRATVTVAAMFVISRGLYMSGAVNVVGDQLVRLLDRSFWLMLVALMLFVAAASAVVNNTAVVAIMIPTVLAALRRHGVGSAKVMIPMSFAAMFGGTCTLLGTSTNILVSSIAADHGQEPFTMFEFLPLGLVFVGLGLAYLLGLGVHLIPERREGAAEEPQAGFDIEPYLTELVVQPDSPLVGQTLGANDLKRELDVDVLELMREHQLYQVPDEETVLKPNDVLRVRCDLKQLAAVERRQGVAIRTEVNGGTAAQSIRMEPGAEGVLLEAVIAPNGPLDGVTLDEIRFRQTHDAVALAVRRGGRVRRDRPQETRLRGGDVLLIKARRGRLDQLSRYEGFVVLSEPHGTIFREGRMWIAIAVVAAVVGSAALDLLPVVVAATAGAIAMVLTRCLRMDEAYEAIDWKVIFLLAGVLSLGAAMEQTGAADWLAAKLLDWTGGNRPQLLLAGFLVLTALLTEVISNNASAALLAPVAIQAANAAGVDPKPFLMAVTYAASLSFMTPIGYQTNTLVYGAGPYRFRDFLRVGTPLNVLFWIVGTLLIPVFWPF